MALPPSPFDRGVWIDIAAQRAARARLAGHSAPQPERPVDCVRQRATASDDRVELVRYGSDGRIQYRFEIAADDDRAQFERWMNALGRRREGRLLKVI